MTNQDYWNARVQEMMVGISVAAVKSRLHRARAELRNQLTAQVYTPKLGCPDIRKVFSQHLEGDITSEICSTMEAHVEACSHCAAECEGLRTVLNACSTVPCEVPPHIQERVHKALQAALRSLPQ